jgi:hypothetical protein
MNKVEYTEINGYAVEDFNQYGLEVGKTQGICPLCSTESLKTKKLSVHPMIGNVD